MSEIDTFVDETMSVMAIVVFIARVDDEFHETERQAVRKVFADYLDRFGNDFTDSEPGKVALERILSDLLQSKPTREGLPEAVGTIERSGRSMRLASFTIRAMRDVAVADGVGDMNEAYWKNAIHVPLHSIATRAR